MYLKGKLMETFSSLSAFGKDANADTVEEQRLPGYLAERYYPVKIGEVFHSKYKVVTKLGYGSASTVWLCRDLDMERYMTVKVHVRSRRKIEEVEISKYLQDLQRVHTGEKYVRLVVDAFEIAGPHGLHPCSVYHPTGIDMGDFMHMLSDDALMLPLLRPMIRIMSCALDYLHSANVVHTDVQPNNMLLGMDDHSVFDQLEDEMSLAASAGVQREGRMIFRSCRMLPTEGEPVLADLGEARICRNKQTDLIMPDVYRAPEVMLGMEWDEKVDLWGLGQSIWTLFEDGHLFARRDSHDELEVHGRLADMTALLGPPPRAFLQRSPHTLKYWDSHGKWRGIVPLPEQTLETCETKLSGNEKAEFLDMMRQLLSWLPEYRPSAEDLLSQPFVRGDDY
ncbi:hypothetical protein MBLNU459_g5514t3 [Dothideomycetes sp. NU459]